MHFQFMLGELTYLVLESAFWAGHGWITRHSSDGGVMKLVLGSVRFRFEADVFPDDVLCSSCDCHGRRRWTLPDTEVGHSTM